ncbi:MAG: tetratricopeptide repeat protein, partial [Longimicrobiales bacterium]|nr:tetratricopeptide repeat protein [Longimicrobiales bacterium]
PDSPLIRFNDGNALYRGEDFQQAMERFLKAAESEDPTLQSAAWYNLGNALYRQQKLQESLEAYKEALRANPSDVDSKYNLERVLEQLQQQEQQSQDQQKQEGQEPQGQETPQSQGEQPPQEENSQEENSQEEDSQEGQAEGQPQPGEMTPEEAEQLLSAIREDPGDVNRRRVPATGKRPRKDW